MKISTVSSVGSAAQEAMETMAVTRAEAASPGLGPRHWQTGCHGLIGQTNARFLAIVSTLVVIVWNGLPLKCSTRIAWAGAVPCQSDSPEEGSGWSSVEGSGVNGSESVVPRANRRSRGDGRTS
jgi:hypothetical protein